MTAFADVTMAVRRQVERGWTEADPDHLDVRLDEVTALLGRARATGDVHLVADAWRLHLMTLLEAERIAQIDVTLGELSQWNAQHQHPALGRVLDWFRGLRAVLDGDPHLAEALFAQSLTPREALGPLTTIRAFQGRFDELETQYQQARRDEPAESSHVLMLAWIWAGQGRTTAARGALDTLGPVGALPRDREWLLRMSLLGEIAVRLADRPLAEKTYAMLAPYSRRIVLIGGGLGCWGTTDRALGLLCRFLGLADAAAEHFTAKIRMAAAAGAHPWLVRGQLDLAELLLEAGEERHAEAERCAREGIAGARRLDYALLREPADELEGRLRLPGVSTGGGDTDGSRPPARAHLSVFGGLMVRSTTGEPARWDSRKARELLCILIAHRGRPVSRERMMEHLWPRQAPARLRNRLAVALATVRRTLDPAGTVARDHYVAATRETLWLRIDHVTVDSEVFLRAAQAALADMDGGDPTETLTLALGHYRGDAFADEPYADWAYPLRDECAAMQVALLHAVITTSPSPVQRAEAARAILLTDPYDDEANRALVQALYDLGARGLAEVTRERFRANVE